MATKTVVRYRNRPAKKRRSKKSFTFPLAIMAPTALIGYNTALYAMNQGPTVALDKLGYWFTGYSVASADWKWWRLKGGLFPMLGGLLVHKGASKLGLNRALASAGVPWIRI